MTDGGVVAPGEPAEPVAARGDVRPSFPRGVRARPGGSVRDRPGGSVRDRPRGVRGRVEPGARPPARADAGRAASWLLRHARVRLLAAISWLVSRLPEGLAIRFADLVGALWYRATPERAALARRQLRRVAEALESRGLGPERARAAARGGRPLERLVRLAYRHAARYYLEVIRTPDITPRYVRERVLIETPGVVEDAFAQDRPVIFVGLHFGAIELPALYLAQRTGRPVLGPMETVGDPLLQAWFVRTRGRVGIRIVGLAEARRELLTGLRAGESVGLVGDRDITGGGIEASLFGHPARLPVGPAMLAVESGAPLYVVAVRRDAPGRYRAQLRRVDVPAEGTRRERVTAAVGRLAEAFEASVAEAPEQWWAVFFPIWPDLSPSPPTPSGSSGSSGAAGSAGSSIEGDR